MLLLMRYGITGLSNDAMVMRLLSCRPGATSGTLLMARLTLTPAQDHGSFDIRLLLMMILIFIG